MAFNENLAGRIRIALTAVGNVIEKKMFGGLAFMANEKMCITVGPGRIMCRIDPAIHDQVIKREGCQTVVMRGKALKGYVHIDEESITTEEELQAWIRLALDYNKTAKASRKK